ncbi:TolC family protein [Flavobacterium tibetense]|jgi:outer membrane protein|uniref:TolC family protein n=1 Tax=Flavobacterium tibetense TaxID=2233533 RepID=A0A365NZT6_9FLAO|nr:TolC family protein [Flavobacterium tibetense]RBA27729.1 TolC family protein [Flavobacterium tibetense]
MIRKRIVFLLSLVVFQLQAQEKKWTLQECVDYAIKNNISVQSSALDLQTAGIAKKDAIGNFMPNFNASASHSWNVGLNQNITTGLLENQTTQFTSAGLNMSVDLFKGLQNQNQLRRSNLSIIASQYQLLKMQEDIALNVANAYLQILFNKENVKVQKQQLTFNESQLQRTTELVNAGQVPQGDLLDIKASVASDKQRLIAAENALLISKLSLAQLLRIEDFQNFDISEEQLDVFDSVIMNESPNAVIQKAKETRTELKIAESNLEIAKKDISIARGAYLPSIVGFYSFNTRAAYFDRIVGFQPNANNPTSVIGFVDGTNQAVLQPNFSPVLGGPLSIWEQFDNNKGQNFGLQMNIPIFNGFATRNNVQRSKVAFERAKLNYDQQNLDLERNVYTAFTDTKAAKESYEAALQTLEARTLSFNYAKDRYEVGLMNVFDFNQAQTLLVNAQSEVLRTKYDYIFRTKILEFYFGIPLIQNN